MSIIQNIRDRGAVISIIIIAIALLGFILMDAFTGRSNFLKGGGSTTLGVINGKKVNAQKFEERVKSEEESMEMQGQQSNAATRQSIIQRNWEMEVEKGVMGAEFDKLGMEVDQKELGDILYGPNPPADLKRAFTNEQGIYDVAMAQSTLNQRINSGNKKEKQQIEAYFEDLKHIRLMEKYTSLLANSINYPKWLIEKQNSEASQLASVSYVKYPYNNIPDSSVLVSDEEIEEYISKHKDQFKQEESRSIAYVVFDAAPSIADSNAVRTQIEGLKQDFTTTTDVATFLATNTSNTPFDESYVKTIPGTFSDSIKGLPVGAVLGPYVENGSYTLAKMVSKKNVPDSSHVRHILIKIAELGPNGQPMQVRDDSSARKLAYSIMNAIARGTPFDTLMNRYSEDRNPQTGIVNNEGKYTVAIGSGFVKNFYDVALYEPPGTKKVIKGESQNYVGYHYVEVLDHQGSGPAYQVAFLSKPIYVSEETNNKAHNAAIQFAAASPDLKTFDANVEKDLKPQGIQKLYAQRITPNDYYIPGINGMSRSLVKNIYEADKGKVVQPELVGDKYIVAVVTDVLDEGTAPASVARPQVEPVLRNKKKAQKIKEQIGKFTTLEEVATKFNLTVDKADSLRFLGGSTNLGFEPKVIGASFNPANTGKTVTEPLEGQTAVYLLRVESLSATPLAAGTIDEQKASFEARARQTAMGGMSMYGGQQPPPHVAVLRKQAKIKDSRSKFY